MFKWTVLALFIIYCKGQQFSLSQDDFKDGAYIIDEPGTYVFTEDVIFQPALSNLQDLVVSELIEPELLMFPSQEQRESAVRAFDLGFFAALVVDSDDVVIDLNGFELSQSHIHGAMQRFYAHIELANSPFPPKAGPADFTSENIFTGANNVTVKNGFLGRSSHHGIHCNRCKDVVIKDLTIKDFEVGGISFNTADNIVFENLVIENNLRDVRYNGHLSNLIFSLQALNLHIEPFIDIPGSLQDEIQVNREAARDVLREVIALEQRLSLADAQFNYEEVNRELSQLNPLVRTITGGYSDGSLVTGILLHASVNVGDFKSELAEDQNENVIFRNVTIKDLSLKTQELTLLQPVSGGDVSDMIGAAFNFDVVRDLSTNDVECVLNPLAALQLSLTRLKLLTIEDENLNPAIKALFDRDGIPESVLTWCDNEISWFDLLRNNDLKVAANKDIMFHQNKGVIGIKIDQTMKVSFEEVEVKNLENHADSRSFFFENLPFADNDKLSEIVFDDQANLAVFTRGVSLAATVDVTGTVEVHSLFSTDLSRTVILDYINFNNEIFVGLEQNSECDKEADLFAELEVFEPLLAYVQRSEFVDLPIAPEELDDGNDSIDQSVLFGIIGVLAILLVGLFVYHINSKGTTNTGRYPSSDIGTEIQGKQ